MNIDLTTWDPGLVFALTVILSVLGTGISIIALCVGLVQWRKVRNLREVRDFIQQLIDQGYTIEEIERLTATFGHRGTRQELPPQHTARPAR